jgi:hypothetical protein
MRIIENRGREMQLAERSTASLDGYPAWLVGV